MLLQKNQTLKPFNTFGVNANANYLVITNSNDSVKEIIHSKIFRENKHIIIGAGSNILFTADFKGLVIKNEIKGIKILESSDDNVLIEAGAGENWHNFVLTCVKNHYFGIENLALIPGSVGAAPVQNIGAYGVEQSKLLHSVCGFDLITGEFKEFSKNDCNFGYRNSIFKTELKDKFLITSVKYRLNQFEVLNTSYNELRLEIEKNAPDKLNAEYLMNTVVKLRQRKLPDTSVLGNAGSFFKNPLIGWDDFEALKNNYKDIPYFGSGNLVKLPAGWLIEKCGWKGKRFGDAGVYDKHALILVNYGTATGEEIYKLSTMIKNSVFEKFGIELVPEVNIIT